jgi:pilus assembly protein CpaB
VSPGRLAGLAPHRLLAAAARHRALLAGGLAAAAVAAGLQAMTPDGGAPVVVLSAAADLAGGAALSEADLVPLPLPADAVPAGALTSGDEVAGRLLAGPVRRGEPLTDVRLLGSDLVPAGGVVAAPLRVAEPAAGALVRVGDRIDVLGASPSGGPAARLVAHDLPVLAVPALDTTTGEGSLLVVAVPPAVAARLAAASVTDRLSLTVRGR